MNIRRLLLLLPLFATPALAQEQRIDATFLYSTDDAPHFGEYSGLQDDGARVVGALDLSGGLDWVSGDNGYWTLRGTNLGLDSYDAELTIGEQGRYDVTLRLDGIQQYKRDDGRTPYIGGGDVLALPSSWTSGPSTADMDLSRSNTRGFDQELQRDIIEFKGSYLFGDRWEASIGFEHEEKDGKRVQAGAIYFDASTSFAALLPAPVDYVTNDFTSSIQYTGDRLVSSLSFLFSDFDNDNQRLTWDNAFSGIGDSTVEYSVGQGSLGEAPDHSRYQFRLAGSYLPPMELLQGLNLQWDAAWDKVEQDDRFEPYTVNPDLLVTTPLPRTDLDAEVETTALDLRANYRPRWRPLRKLTLRGSYHYDDRDYDRPRDAYQYVRGDGADQPATIQSIFANSYDNQREGFDLAGDYRLPWWRSKLTLEYDYQQVERSNSSVGETETDTYRAVLRASPLMHVTSRLSWSFADRKVDDYQFDESFFVQRTTEFINQTPDNQRFDNHPALSQYQLANSETDAVKFDVGYSGLENWYFSADVQWRDINYDKSIFGLIEAESWFYGLDTQYSPQDDLSVFGYLSYTRFEPQSAGRSFSGGAEKVANDTIPPLAQGSDPSRDWSVNAEDEVWTLGGGVTWRYSETLDFEAQYVYVDTQSSNDFASGGAADLDTTPLPDIETTLHSFTLSADYQWRDDMTVVVSYQYYNYEEDDWALDGTSPDTLDNVLLLGEQPDDEDVSLIGVSFRYDF